MEKLLVAMLWLFAGLSFLAGDVAIGQIVPPISPPPLPIIETFAPVAAANDTAQRLIIWQNRPIACDGIVRQPLTLARPVSSIGWVSAVNGGPKPVIIDFAIDANGRAHAIRRTSAAFAPFSDDLEPVLATMKFTPGAAHARCQITYEATASDFGAAPMDSLIDYAIFPGGAPLPKAGHDRIAPAGSTCLNAPPAVRNRVYPDFKAIPQAPGVRNWSMIGFDVDARGRPTKMRVVQSTGNIALDHASIKAVAESRFEPRARQGCVYPYWKTATPLAAPAIPADLARAGTATCPASDAWKTKPVLRFPEAYRRHGVEGWAVISYDVAPWGATGNARVVASEPSARFGMAALDAVRFAAHAPSPQGQVNCVTRVRFVIADTNMPAPAVSAEPQAPF